MPLVDYPDSDDSDRPRSSSSINAQGTKRKRSSPSAASLKTAPLSTLPPLPSTFHDLYATSTRLSSRDDPSLHGGRQRQTLHVEGNWPTHVYIESDRPTVHPPLETLTRLHTLITNLNSDIEDNKLRNDSTTAPNDKVKHLPSSIHTLLFSALSTPLPLHISLSAPLTLRSEQRSPFLQELTERIDRADITPFTLKFSPSPDWHPNNDLSRYFLVLRLLQSPPTSSTKNQSILNLLIAANATASLFGQAQLYTTTTAPTNPTQTSFHHDIRKAGKSRSAPSPGTTPQDSQLAEGKTLQAIHISIAWSLSPPQSPRLSTTPHPSLPPPPSPAPQDPASNTSANTARGSVVNVKADEHKQAGADDEVIEVKVEAVKVKMGNVIHSISLRRDWRKERAAGSGVLGDR